MKYSVCLEDDTNKTAVVDSEMNVADALIEIGAHVQMPCGGKGICGKCRVRIRGELSEPTAIEKKNLGENSKDRLACQAFPEGNVTVKIQSITSGQPFHIEQIDVQSEFGIAVDIGTTSVQIALVDLSSGEAFLTDTFLNPQRRFGDDTMSRIAAAADTAVFKKQVQLIREAIYSSCIRTISALSLTAEKIKRIAVCGNTTMLHFLFGMNVSSMGTYPFTPEAFDFAIHSPETIDMPLFADAELLSLPAISAFLGSDVLGGLAICFEDGFDKNTCFIDLGTNGEIFLINNDGNIYAASCAMGPALEGMNISCGMTATSGAITHFSLSNGKVKFEILGDELPVGLSGTGLIDLIAILHRANIIQDSGAFNGELETMRLPEPLVFSVQDQMKHILLSDGVSLSQADIRNLQLSKGASHAATELLMVESNSQKSKIDNVVIAGSLGEHLSIDQFNHLGFLPEFPNAEFSFRGNTSLMAAQKVCIEPEFIKMASLLRDRVIEVQLNCQPEFNDKFVDALNF